MHLAEAKSQLCKILYLGLSYMIDLWVLHHYHCCNLSGGVALNVLFITNGICAKNNNMYMWREQAIIEWSWHVNSIVAYCHSAKLCAHAVWSQQHGAVTRIWRSCCVKPSQKERAIGVVRCKKEGCCCNLSVGVDCVIHYKLDVRERSARREQAIIEWLRRMISIVACCHSAMLCAHAARAFQSQHHIPLWNKITFETKLLLIFLWMQQ